MPLATQVDFHAAGEIHGRIHDRDADIAQVAGAVTRRNVETAAERDGQMREVPADPLPFGEGLRGGSGRPGISVIEGNVLVYEIADGLDACPARRQVSE